MVLTADAGDNGAIARGLNAEAELLWNRHRSTCLIILDHRCPTPFYIIIERVPSSRTALVVAYREQVTDTPRLVSLPRLTFGLL